MSAVTATENGIEKEIYFSSAIGRMKIAEVEDGEYFADRKEAAILNNDQKNAIVKMQKIEWCGHKAFDNLQGIVDRAETFLTMKNGKKMTSKYNGVCKISGRDIMAGDEIVYKYHHGSLVALAEYFEN